MERADNEVGPRLSLEKWRLDPKVDTSGVVKRDLEGTKAALREGTVARLRVLERPADLLVARPRVKMRADDICQNKEEIGISSGKATLIIAIVE